MWTVTEHKPSKQLACCLAVCALAVLSACDVRARGDADVLAVSRHKPDKPTWSAPAAPTPASAAPATTDTVARPSPTPNTQVPKDIGFAAAAGSGSADDGPGQAAAGAPSSTPATPRFTPDPTITDGAVETPLVPYLFWADVVNNLLWRSNIDGSDRQLAAGEEGLAAPAGLVVDPEDKQIYWTNMGTLVGGENTGTLRRKVLGAEDVETVIPVGTTNTPKQVRIDPVERKLYWCDREGARVWRSALDGSDVEVLIRDHSLLQPVGLALDLAKRQLYFSDRMSRKIFRASFDIPDGQTEQTRRDVETLLSFDVGSMPLDVELDLDERQIYWTDRARGTIHRAGMDPPPEQSSYERTDIETILSGLVEPIGISLDDVDRRMYFSQLSGEIGRVNLDGTQHMPIVSAGSASGLTLARLPLQQPQP